MHSVQKLHKKKSLSHWRIDHARPHTYFSIPVCSHGITEGCMCLYNAQ